VLDVRVKGAIGVVQMDAAKIDIQLLRKKFIERGVWLRPFKDIIYIMPSLTISEAELGKLAESVVSVLK
jgi:adenosylmethionine-8-amino-7-oxononanoate aminotransferase